MGWLDAGQSITVLNSQNIHRTFNFTLQHVARQRRLSFHQTPGYLVLEGYYHHSVSSGVKALGSNQTDSLGILAMARYEYRTQRRPFWFAEIGWGLQWASKSTFDLNSQFNSTPVVSGGVILPTHGNELYLGLRYLHISNGGLKKPNNGQNQIHLIAGIKL